MRSALILLTVACGLLAEERRTDPTFLRRRLPDFPAVPSEITTPACRYRAGFGAGAPQTGIARGVARFGEVAVEAGGSCAPVSYPREEQIYVVMEGAGSLDYSGEKHAVRKNDFFYIPPGVKHALAGPCRAIVMGFKIPAGMAITLPGKFQIASIDDVKQQVVGNHPPSTLYQLLLGDLKSTRDRIAAGHVVTSLFIMNFAPGGTNAPHHHDREEEIYLLVDGKGEMVAGCGLDGVEGRYPAAPGDAYFFRLNATVGFYNESGPGAQKARILAVRSLYPR